MGSDLSKPRTKKDCLDKKCSLSEHCLYSCNIPINACPPKPNCSISRLKKKLDKHRALRLGIDLDAPPYVNSFGNSSSCGGPPPPCCPPPCTVKMRQMVRQSCPNESPPPCIRGSPCLYPCPPPPQPPPPPSCIAPCRQPCPPPAPPPPPPFYYQDQPPPSCCENSSNCSSSSNKPKCHRYKPTTSRPALIRRGEEDILVETYEIHDQPRERCVMKYAPPPPPVLYENFDKFPPMCDYDIRKEKTILINKCSISPPRIRSKSSDRHLIDTNCTKSVRIVDDCCYDTEYESSSGGGRRQQPLQSRSGYYLSGAQLAKGGAADERSPCIIEYGTISKREARHRSKYRHYEDNYCDDYHHHQPTQQQQSAHHHSSRSLNKQQQQQQQQQHRRSADLRDLSSASSSKQNLNNQVPNCNDIVYVPMVKEHFIQRESAKLGGGVCYMTTPATASAGDILNSQGSEQTRNGDSRQSYDKYKQKDIKTYMNPNEPICITEILNNNNQNENNIGDNYVDDYNNNNSKMNNLPSSAFTIPVKSIIKSSNTTTVSSSCNQSSKSNPIYTNGTTLGQTTFIYLPEMMNSGDGSSCMTAMGHSRDTSPIIARSVANNNNNKHVYYQQQQQQQQPSQLQSNNNQPIMMMTTGSNGKKSTNNIMASSSASNLTNNNGNGAYANPTSSTSTNAQVIGNILKQINSSDNSQTIRL